MNYEGTIETDPDTGEQLLIFPDDMMEQLGWKEGDEIDLQQNEQGDIIITNLSKENV